MTTLAYDSKSIACDSQLTAEDRRLRQKKWLKLPDGTLLVYAGAAAEFQAFVRWLLHDGRQSEFPKAENLTVVIVHPCGTVEVIDEDNCSLDTTDKLFVAGSGGPIALGAMAAGLSAKEAVQIAAKYDTGTNPDVDVFPVPERMKDPATLPAWASAVRRSSWKKTARSPKKT